MDVSLGVYIGVAVVEKSIIVLGDVCYLACYVL